MSIKEKLEEVKAKTKKHFRKAALSAAVMGTLGAGAVACGEGNVKGNVKNNDKEKARVEVFSEDDIELSKAYARTESRYEGHEEEASLFEQDVYGLPLRKHANNPNDPDSLLVEAKHSVFEELEDTIVASGKPEPKDTTSKTEITKGKYVAIAPEDKDKEFVRDYDSESFPKYIKDIHYKTHEVEVTTPTTYDAEGRHPGKVEKKKEADKIIGERTFIYNFKYKSKE